MEIKDTVVKVADVANPLLSSPAGPLEGVAMASSFEPSLMPRTSIQQGIMMALGGLTARATVVTVERGARAVTPSNASLPARLAIRGAIAAIGTGLTMIPRRPGEPLWKSGIDQMVGHVPSSMIDATAATSSSTAAASVASALSLSFGSVFDGLRLNHRSPRSTVIPSR